MTDVGGLLQLANQYAHETDNKLKYTSDFKGDRKTFSAKWQAPVLPEDLAGKYVYGLALLADDGCNVEVNQKRVLSLYEKPIALPDIANSLHILDARIEPGVEADIRIEYANVKYTPRDGAPDIDGCTLFVYLKPAVAGDVHLESVSFGGDGVIPLCSDTSLQAYPVPQWKDANGDGLPDRAADGSGNDSVAYVKKGRPSIGAVFKVGGLPQGAQIEFRAKAPNGMEVKSPKPLQVDEGKAALPSMLVVDGAGDPLFWPDHITIYRKSYSTAFTLNWEYRIDGQDWIPLVSTKHQVYITAAPPAVANKQETLFYYACNRADGDSGADGKAVAHKIYGDFQTLEMKRVDRFSGIPAGISMAFYPNGDNRNVVRDGKGICGGWASFFRDVLKVHGYPSEQYDVTSANIVFTDREKHVGSGWLPKNNPKPAEKLIQAGQGKMAAGFSSSSWTSHAIVVAYGDYFDPSYGVGPSATPDEHEVISIDFYYYAEGLGPFRIYHYDKKSDIPTKQLDYAVHP